MGIQHLGNIPQSLLGVNARETCTSFWTGRFPLIFQFCFVGVLIYYLRFSEVESA